MPPRKTGEDGEVEFLSVHAPLSTPLSFASPTVLCHIVGSSICLLDIKSGKQSYLHTTAYGITRLNCCPTKGYLAFCEGGTSPHVYVYSVDPTRLLFTLSNVTELEIADLAFSHCGSRLYTLSRATTKKLTVFSTVNGERLKGCELNLPLRFDKVSVFPGHKDRVALVRSSSVRIVSMQKSFETYICRLQPSSLPADVDISISAFAWTRSGYFVFATRQGALCTLDGATGAMLHACQASQPITSIAVTADHIMTVHIGNQLNFWAHDPTMLSTDHSASLVGNVPPMEGSGDGRPCVYNLQKSANLQRCSLDRRPEQRLHGQIAHMQVTPEQNGLCVTTAEGEVWTMPMSDLHLEGIDMDLPADKFNWMLLSWFHTHPITDVCMFGKSPQVCATSDEGGRIRIWELSRGLDTKGFRSLRFTSAITSMAADAEGKLLIVGSDSGCIHVVAADDWRQSRVQETVRISEAGVALVRCITHTERCVVVAAALYNHKVALLTILYRDPKPRMLGFIDLGPSAKVEDLCFHIHDFKPEAVLPAKLFIVGTQQVVSGEPPSSCVWYFKTPPLDYDPSTINLARDVCPMVSSRLSLKQGSDRATTVASATRKAVAIGFATGTVALYALPSTVGPLNAKVAAVEAEEILPPHGQFVTCMHVPLDGKCLLSACMDGSIRKLSLEDSSHATSLQKFVHNPYNGGVAALVANEDLTVMASTGGADGIFVWSDPAAVPSSTAPPNQAAPVDEKIMEAAVVDVDDRSADYKVWAPVSAVAKQAAAQAEAGDDPEVSAVAAAQRKALLLEVDTLRKKLRSLVDQNNNCPDLEKIDRAEFCIDYEEKDIIAAKTKERCDALRAQLERENHARQLTRDRLIKEFWDPMRTKGCLISSLMSNLCVSNYPERIISPEETSTIKKLRIMRQIEQLEEKATKDGSVPKELQQDITLRSEPFTTGQEKYIVNWWAKHGQQGGAAGEGGEEAPESPKAKKKENAEPDPVDQAYLYEPFELLTNSRRRLQVYLLQSLAAEYRAQFNTLFEECQGTKQDVKGQIKEKLARIRAILGELQIVEVVPEPQQNELEEVGAVLKVRDEEIKAEKFVSEEEKQRLAVIQAKEDERLRALKENDAGQRALMQMMGGTLKTKKDLSALEIVLDKEVWMDEIPEEEMTDLQRAQYTEFLGKEKALAEEQDKYRKQLDAEHKRLLQEVQEVTQSFEGTLKELHHQRFSHDAKFFCQELYCVRLQLALLQNVEDNVVLETSTKDVQTAKDKWGAAEDKLHGFSRQVQEKRERQDERVRHEREVASAQHFRQQFANSGLEPDSVTAMLHIFRKRPDKGKTTDGRHGSTVVGANGTRGSFNGDPYDPATSSDPYADLGTPAAEASQEVVEDDVPEEECPEGVDEGSFRRMNELRRERMYAETEVQKGNVVLQEMQGLLSHLQRERDDVKGEYDQLCLEMQEHKALMDRELYDVELLFKLRQGQVEVPQAAVVTDYSDAVIIDTEVVDSRNRRIQELGKHKVGTLETTKEFRKKMLVLEWEQRTLAMSTTDLEQRTMDVHMLRVTKGLQSLLKGGEEGRNKADADLLERKIEHLNTTTQQKEQSLKKQYAMGSKANKLRKMENGMLEKKLRELQQNVIQREHIRRLRAPQGGGGAGGAREGERPRICGGGGRIEENEGAIRQAQQGFKEVKTRQSLMDAAKKHTEEIDLLRRELDRLRQRTFPSFVQLHEDSSQNPDFRG